MKVAKSVDEYIGNTPKEAQPKLKQIRAAIREVAHDAVESISYGMPFYSFSGESGFGARLCYFGLMKNQKKIAFYTRPMYLEEYKEDVVEYLTSKSALQFSLKDPIPVQLIKKIVRNGLKKHKVTK